MRLPLCTAILLLVGAAFSPVLAANEGEWGPDIRFTTDWDQAIRSVQETGKMLFIYNGWERSGIWAPCDGLKAAVRGLAEGEEGYEKYPKLLAKNFVFLNVYCRSVQEEHDPRGPEGPFRFKDRSVPVLVIKKHDGETITQQLGFYSDAKVAKGHLKGFVDGAIQEHGPIIPPRAVAKLMKPYNKGMKYLDKDRPGLAYKELSKVIEAGNDTKEFPEGPPSMAVTAKEKVEAILEAGKRELDAALTVEDAGAKEKALKAVKRRYKDVDEIRKKAEEGLAASK